MKKRTALIGLAAVIAVAAIGWLIGSRTGGDTERSAPASADAKTGHFPEIVATAEPAASGAAAPDAAASGERVPAGNVTAAATLDRTIIRTAALDLSVENVTRTFEDVGRIATGAGGFVASSSLGKQRIGTGEYQVGSITVRVPDRQYENVMASLRRLAVEVVNEQSESSDVTEEFTDLQARLRNLEATERQYLAFLERAQDLDDVLVITDRVNQVRAEIEQVQGRINLLQNLSDLATITVHLTPVAAGGPAPSPEADNIPNPLTAARDAWQRSLQTLAIIAGGVLAVAVYSWWLVPPAGVAVLGLRAWWRRARPTPGSAS
jgi:hypothetical protein